MSRPSKPLKRVQAAWTEVVLVCRKCSRKLDGGFGADGEQRFSKALRQALPVPETGRKAKGRRAKLGIIEVGCLDICPKGAVVALRAGAPGAWLVVPAGTPMGTVALDLGLSAAIRGDAEPNRGPEPDIRQ